MSMAAKKGAGGKRRAEKRVPNQYHLSVPNVLFGHFALPTVPQN
jgi:hypothetical protein